MYQCSYLYQYASCSRKLFKINLGCTPESIPREVMEQFIQRTNNYKRPVEIIECSWIKVPNNNLNISKIDYEDINIPETKIESIRNGIAERMAHGMNANEILRDLIKITRPELIRVIMDILVKN
jgi:predicted HAD superfamily phosphohydrolase